MTTKMKRIHANLVNFLAENALEIVELLDTIELCYPVDYKKFIENAFDAKCTTCEKISPEDIDPSDFAPDSDDSRD
jgi:hypothetical protein